MSGGSRFRAVRRLLAGSFRRYWRQGVAALVAMAGLALAALGPVGLVMAWREQSHEQWVRAAHQIGDPVRDGPVTFVVHEVRCGADGGATHGRRCEVTLGARNDGEEELTVPGGAQTLHVSQGARHQPATTDAERFTALAPYQAATAVIAYDLPLDATITHLELRADTYSRGVPVAVGTPYPLLSTD